ncbi:hypothetical protein Trydic_g3209 [Trypoxylus dichotomus]
MLDEYERTAGLRRVYYPGISGTISRVHNAHFTYTHLSAFCSETGPYNEAFCTEQKRENCREMSAPTVLLSRRNHDSIREEELSFAAWYTSEC